MARLNRANERGRRGGSSSALASAVLWSCCRAAQRAFQTFLSLFTVLHQHPPMTSHSQLLISNQCRVLNPPPSFFSLAPWASWSVDWFAQMTTATLRFSVRGKRLAKHPFLGQVFALPLPFAFSLGHASHLWHAKVWFSSKAGLIAQILFTNLFPFSAKTWL